MCRTPSAHSSAICSSVQCSRRTKNGLLAGHGQGLTGLLGRAGTRPEIRAGDTRHPANGHPAPSLGSLPFQKSTRTKPAQLCAATKEGQSLAFCPHCFHSPFLNAKSRNIPNNIEVSCVPWDGARLSWQGVPCHPLTLLRGEGNLLVPGVSRTQGSASVSPGHFWGRKAKGDSRRAAHKGTLVIHLCAETCLSRRRCGAHTNISGLFPVLGACTKLPLLSLNGCVAQAGFGSNIAPCINTPLEEGTLSVLSLNLGIAFHIPVRCPWAAPGPGTP